MAVATNPYVDKGFSNRVAVVVIGRNEGRRLHACLRSLKNAEPLVYVDSGSTDQSVHDATELGFPVIRLSEPPGFSAARARNAGTNWLYAKNPGLQFVQTVDGDCEIAAGWIAAAEQALVEDVTLVAVFGRLRERHPEASVYNMMCDREWDGPLGEVNSCGGIAMYRMSALADVGGFSETMIAGEEPDLCLRLRSRHGRISRIDDEMGFHDAAIYSHRQWWRRVRRGGHAFAQLVDRHRRSADPRWIRQLVSMGMWSMIVIGGASLVLIGLLAHGLTAVVIGVVLLFSFMAQTARLALRQARSGMALRQAASWAFLLMTGKLAQTQGALQYVLRRVSNNTPRLIEYKTSQ